MLVLEVHAPEVPEGRDAQGQHVGTVPQGVAVQEAGRRLVGGVRAADAVAGGLQAREGLRHPAALGVPVRHGSGILVPVAHALVDGRVVGHLHLVDGHALGVELEYALDAVRPVGLGLAHHAGDQVDVDLVEAGGADEGPGAVDLGRAVRAVVGLEDVGVEVLDPQAQARDAEVAQQLDLALLQGAGLALERDLLGRGPGQARAQPAEELLELLAREVRGRAAAEVDEARAAAGDQGSAGVELELALERVEVAADLGRVLVGVDLEVAEVAALAAEGQVDVEAERGAGLRAAAQAALERPDLCGRPEGEGRVVRDEVVADGRRRGGLGLSAHAALLSRLPGRSSTSARRSTRSGSRPPRRPERS